VVLIWDALLAGFLPEDKGPYALTPNTVELILPLGPFSPDAGPSRTRSSQKPLVPRTAGRHGGSQPEAAGLPF